MVALFDSTENYCPVGGVLRPRRVEGLHQILDCPSSIVPSYALLFLHHGIIRVCSSSSLFSLWIILPSATSLRMLLLQVCVLGGTVTFSALTARALGLRVGIVTAAAQDLSLNVLDGITVVSVPSEYTTTYENIYGKEGRKQVLHHQAAQISFESVPEAWRNTSILHLGPLAQELDPQLPKGFAPSLLGVTPQGWMRTWDAQGHVSPCKWESAEMLLPQAGAVVISREDVGGDEEVIEEHGTPNARVGCNRRGSGRGAVLERGSPPFPRRLK